MSDRPRRGSFEPPAPAPGTRVEVALDDPAWPAAVWRLGLSPMQASVVALMTQDATAEEIAVMLGGGGEGEGGWTPSMAAVYMEDIIHQLGVFDRDGLKHAVVRALMVGEERK